MESTIARAIGMTLSPVALLYSEVRPDGAMQFAEERRGCVMWLLACAAKGEAAYADTATSGCTGGGVGLGFGNQYRNFAVPFAVLSRMEADAPDSFLERDTWRALMAENPG